MGSYCLISLVLHSEIHFLFFSFDIKFHMICLSWWFDWILSNRSSWMQKYSWSTKFPSGFSVIPFKVHQEFYQIVIFVVNNKSFSRFSSYRSRLTHIARNTVHDNWLLFLILKFPYRQYKISSLWWLLHMISETNSQQSIGIIDIRRHDPHHL